MVLRESKLKPFSPQTRPFGISLVPRFKAPANQAKLPYAILSGNLPERFPLRICREKFLRLKEALIPSVAIQTGQAGESDKVPLICEPPAYARCPLTSVA